MVSLPSIWGTPRTVRLMRLGVFGDDRLEQIRLEGGVIGHWMTQAARRQDGIGGSIELGRRLLGLGHPGVELFRRGGDGLEMLLGKAAAGILGVSAGEGAG